MINSYSYGCSISIAITITGGVSLGISYFTGKGWSLASYQGLAMFFNFSHDTKW